MFLALLSLESGKAGELLCRARSYRLILGLIRSRGLAPSAFTFIPDCIAACLSRLIVSSYPVLQAGLAPEQGSAKGEEDPLLFAELSSWHA